MSKKQRTGLWLIVGEISVVVAMVMSPWSVLACVGSFAIGVAVSMHSDGKKANEADD